MAQAVRQSVPGAAISVWDPSEAKVATTPEYISLLPSAVKVMERLAPGVPSAALTGLGTVDGEGNVLVSLPLTEEMYGASGRVVAVDALNDALHPADRVEVEVCSLAGLGEGGVAVRDDGSEDEYDVVVVATGAGGNGLAEGENELHQLGMKTVTGVVKGRTDAGAADAGGERMALASGMSYVSRVGPDGNSFQWSITFASPSDLPFAVGGQESLDRLGVMLKQSGMGEETGAYAALQDTRGEDVRVFQARDREMKGVQSFARVSERAVGVGDVVHPMSGFGGWGAVAALEDAALLGSLLGLVGEGKVGLEAALGVYDADRVDRVSTLAVRARNALATCHAKSWLGTRMRNGVLGFTGKMMRRAGESLPPTEEYLWSVEGAVEDAVAKLSEPSATSANE